MSPSSPKQHPKNEMIYSLRRTKICLKCFRLTAKIPPANFLRLQANLCATLKNIRRQATECASLWRRKRHFWLLQGGTVLKSIPKLLRWRNRSPMCNRKPFTTAWLLPSPVKSPHYSCARWQEKNDKTYTNDSHIGAESSYGRGAEYLRRFV